MSGMFKVKCNASWCLSTNTACRFRVLIIWQKKNKDCSHQCCIPTWSSKKEHCLGLRQQTKGWIKSNWPLRSPWRHWPLFWWHSLPFLPSWLRLFHPQSQPCFALPALWPVTEQKHVHIMQTCPKEIFTVSVLLWFFLQTDEMCQALRKSCIFRQGKSTCFLVDFRAFCKKIKKINKKKEKNQTTQHCVNVIRANKNLTTSATGFSVLPVFSLDINFSSSFVSSIFSATGCFFLNGPNGIWKQ